jgi:hypothetical protein
VPIASIAYFWMEYFGEKPVIFISSLYVILNYPEKYYLVGGGGVDESPAYSLLRRT